MNKERWLPGGDKFESIKADEQWEKANAEVDQCEICGVVGCQGECEKHVVNYFTEIVDISEEK